MIIYKYTYGTKDAPSTKMNGIWLILFSHFENSVCIDKKRETLITARYDEFSLSHQKSWEHLLLWYASKTFALTPRS